MKEATILTTRPCTVISQVDLGYCHEITILILDGAYEQINQNISLYIYVITYIICI